MPKFVPFNKFEKSCSPAGAPLNETMQESCNEKFQPDGPIPCNDTPCPPYWQSTGEIRCLAGNLVDAEEQDGCGNSRWVRRVQSILWANTATSTRCVNNRVEQEQVNQCGDTRWIDTKELCCTPVWAATGLSRCSQSLYEIQEADGCGATRWTTTNQSVVWTNTGSTRCIGSVFELEQQNQCGDVRWLASNQPVSWSLNGATQCVDFLLQRQEQNQCGSTRWVNTNEACGVPSVHTVTSVVGSPLSDVEGANFCWTINLNSPVLVENLTLTTVLTGDEQTQRSYTAPSVVVPVGASSAQVCVLTTDDAIQEITRQLCLKVALSARLTASPTPVCVSVLDNDATGDAVFPTGISSGCIVDNSNGSLATFALILDSSGTFIRTMFNGSMGTTVWLPEGQASSSFEMMVSFASGVDQYQGPTPDTWVNLGTSRSMVWNQTVKPSSGTIEDGILSIRRVDLTGNVSTFTFTGIFISRGIPCP